MATRYRKSGNVFVPMDTEMLNLHDTLPVGNYTIKIDQHENFFLESVDNFDLKHKIYGDTLRNTDRVIQTFQDRPNSTGVLLTGEKGSGKTLLAKAIAMKAADLGMPTIIINTAWHGEQFNTLMQSIDQPCVILFDEFEKVYDRETQPAVLTLLDGVFPSKKLFVLTCNDKWRIDEHMRNRPGRIYYLLDFHGLDINFITEYCDENLTDKTQTEHVCRLSTMFSEFNFDMLKSLCEEMNRYNESAQEAIKMLNAKPQTDDGGRYAVSLTVDGVTFPNELMETTEWRGNPLKNETLSFETYAADTKAKGVPAILKTNNEYRFTYTHLKKIDPAAGTFTYINDQGHAVTFTKIKTWGVEYAF